MAQSAPRHPHDHRHRAAPAVPDLGRVVHELVEAGGDEVVELHLADRPLTGKRGADAHAEHAALGQRRVDDPVAELVQQRTQQQEGVAVAAADVLAVDEDARIGAQRVADAERDRLEERPAAADRPARLARPAAAAGRRSTCDRAAGSSGSTRTRGASSARTPAPACFRRRPRRVDDRARLGLDQRFGLPPDSSRSLGGDDAVGFEPRRVRRDRILPRPEVVELAIDVAAVAPRPDSPTERRLLAEVEHVVVMRVAAHAHADELDQRRTHARRARDRPPT